MPSIAKVPTEILDQIFKYLQPDPAKQYGPTYNQYHRDLQNFLAIQFVCKRWSLLFDTVLIRELHFGNNGWTDSRRTTGLLQKLQSHSHLRHRVQNVTIYLQNLDDHISAVIASILAFCTSIRTMELNAPWTHDTWPIVHAIARLPGLQHLSLSPQGGWMLLGIVLGSFNQRSLTSLCLQKYRLEIPTTHRRDAPMVACSTPKAALAEIRNLVDHQPSEVRDLELKSPSVMPEVTEAAVRQCRRLRKWTLRDLLRSEFASHYTPAIYQRILDIHAASLEYICLGRLVTDSPTILDFRHFASLKELRLHARDVFLSRPSEFSTKISAPSLHHLNLAYAVDTRYNSVKITDIGQETVGWLIDFVVHHISGAHHKMSQLGSIMIEFEPRYKRLYGRHRNQLWPWEYLIRARDALSPYHLELKWSEPTITREKWESPCILIPQHQGNGPRQLL